VATKNQDIEDQNSDKVDYLVNDFRKLEVKTDDSLKHLSMVGHFKKKLLSVSIMLRLFSHIIHSSFAVCKSSVS
jgi:hypothetical protein